MIRTVTSHNKLVKFGYGTLRIMSAYIGGKGVLTLNTAEETPIGSSRPSGKTELELINEAYLSEVILEFDNIKSLEVLILKLQEVRAMMLGCDITLFEEWKKNHDITTIYRPNLMIDNIVLKGDGGYNCVQRGYIDLNDNSSTLPSMFAKVKRTNREIHEDAAGMGLDNSYFVSQGIDPDAYYHTTRSHNAAKVLEKMVAKVNEDL